APPCLPKLQIANRKSKIHKNPLKPSNFSSLDPEQSTRITLPARPPVQLISPAFSKQKVAPRCRRLQRIAFICAAVAPELHQICTRFAPSCTQLHLVALSCSLKPTSQWI